MPAAAVSGASIHHRVAGAPVGKSPPLLLVHGAGGNLMHWPGELRRLHGYRIYAIDLPGHGKSGGPGCSQVGDYAALLLDLVGELKLPSFVLAGHSMGGAIAQEFALRYPGRLAGLILVGTGARLRVAPQILHGTLADFEGTARLLAQWTHGPETDPNLLRLYMRRLQEVAPAVLHGDFVACDAFDRRPDVARIDLPSLIVCGAEDRMTPVKYSEFLRDQIARSELHVVPGAGHMVMLEQPVIVSNLARSWLERLPSV